MQSVSFYRPVIAPRTVRTQRGFHGRSWHTPGGEFAACCVDEREQHRQVPCDGDVAAEGAVALSPFDERHQDGEDWLVHGVEVGVGEAGVDLDEGVEAASVRHAAVTTRPSASAGSPRAGSTASIASVTSEIARCVTASIRFSRVGKCT